MAFTISVETNPGSGVYTDLTAYLLFSALQPPLLKANTLDFALLNAPIGSFQLGAAVTTTDPSWKGSIVSAMVTDPVDLRNDQTVTAVTATNTDSLFSDTAPFDLSDVPVGGLFDLLLEDASGHIMLEAGTDFQPGALLLEGTLSYGYRGLSVRRTVNPGGAPKTLGQVTVYQPGLRPGHNFKLTSLNQGYPGTYALEDGSGSYLLEDASGEYELEGTSSFQVTQAGISWPTPGIPSYYIEFGDTPDTLAAWTLAHATPVVAPVAPPLLFPAGVSIFGKVVLAGSGLGLQTMGGGIVTLGSATFTVNADSGHSLTCQVQGAVDGIAYAWDNYVPVPRRAVRATLSGGIYTGAWQEFAYGWGGGSTAGFRATFDLSSASGIALASGTYTITIDINTVESNQLQIFSGWVQAAIIQT